MALPLYHFQEAQRLVELEHSMLLLGTVWSDHVRFHVDRSNDMGKLVHREQFRPWFPKEHPRQDL